MELFTMVLTVSLLGEGAGPIAQKFQFQSNAHCMRVAQENIRYRALLFNVTDPGTQFTIKAECLDSDGRIISTLSAEGN